MAGTESSTMESSWISLRWKLLWSQNLHHTFRNIVVLNCIVNFLPVEHHAVLLYGVAVVIWSHLQTEIFVSEEGLNF